ncbi:EF-P 5-aminopentanol modification-associated protein YfmH [Paenibacillus wulumuqiensis]|uniref:EF-P 5-aminopentanol modification-associated protein YfmH n=1 Tax=Paenibacillus wulumuqiensis TaxID=1567107 RepID=UPI000619C2E7|nr:pitrilysin family protein [Paenibacillus wulumuqiensis]
MESIHYDRLQETLYHEKLDNGLEVYVLPKEGFQKTYATFATRYGSVDNHFQVEGQEEVKVPDGIAHFLEHKMFEEPDGVDVFSKFSAKGASANAFTSFEQTVYLFSATEQIEDNLDTLLNYVQNPYFTKENVDKEKGIIGQEIQMYNDNPDWRVYYGLIEAMYQKHPVRIDIAGTIESISGITKDTLYTCYNTFYHPSNMMLFVVGGVNPEQVIEQVRRNQAAKNYEPQGQIHRYFDEEPAAVGEKWNEIKLPVSQPKFLMGFKETDTGLTGEALQRKNLTTKLMLDLLLGNSTALYQQLYDEDLISDDFGYDYTSTSEYAYSMIGGDTRDPKLLVQRLQEEIGKVVETGFSQEAFDRSLRKRIGNYLRLLNSPESIAHEFTRNRFKDSDFFAILPIYESLTLDDVNQRLRDHMNWEQLAVSVVVSP